MDDWIFTRPPYRPTARAPEDRFELRIFVRYDLSIVEDVEQLNKLNDAIYEARTLLEDRLSKLFGDEFMLDADSSPFLCGPRNSNIGVDEFFIVVGSDFYRRKD